MKTKIWLHIPNEFKEELNIWNDCYSYDYSDYAAYCLIEQSMKYEKLISYLNLRGINYHIFRREYSFSKREKESSQILRLIIDGEAKDSESNDEEYSTCSECDSRLPNLYRDKISVFDKNIKKYDISATYKGYREIIISEKLKGLFVKEGIKGVDYRPIYQLGTDQIIENYYYLILEVGIGETVKPTLIDRGMKCSSCGYYDKFLKQSPLYFYEDSWKGSDIFFTENWFGQPVYKQDKYVMISQKLYQLLKDYKIKGFSVEPAFFVDKN